MNGMGFFTGDNTGCERSQKRRRDLVELAGIYLLILVVIWTPRPWQDVLWLVGGAAVGYVGFRSFEGFTPMGLCRANLLRSLWAVGLAFVIGILSVLLAARLHTLHVPGTWWLFVQHYGAYILWAAVQQIVLQWFFLSRSLRLLPDATSAAAITAGLFAVAHLPNPVLTVVTLFFGMASCMFFIHYRNLVPLAIAHGILGTVIGITIPSHLDHNMRVGINYLTYVDRPSLHETAWLPKP
jgi:hypothetical protein